VPHSRTEESRTLWGIGKQLPPLFFFRAKHAALTSVERISFFVHSQYQLQRVVNKPRHTSIKKTITKQFPQRKVFHRDGSGRQRAEVLYVGAKLTAIVRSGIRYQAGYGHNVYNNMQQFKGSGDGK
jgi:hypothetical protein